MWPAGAASDGGKEEKCPSPRGKKVPTPRSGVPGSEIKQGTQLVYTRLLPVPGKEAEALIAPAQGSCRKTETWTPGLAQLEKAQVHSSDLIISGEEDLRNEKAPKWAAQCAFFLHFGITDKNFGSQIAQHPTKPFQMA